MMKGGIYLLSITCKPKNTVTAFYHLKDALAEVALKCPNPVTINNTGKETYFFWSGEESDPDYTFGFINTVPLKGEQ